MTRRALLIPDCGAGVGLGHLERLLALADALRPDFSSLLVTPHDVGLRQRVVDRGHHALAMAGTTVERAERAAAAYASVDTIVLDGYVFDVALQAGLRKRAPLAVVDDLSLGADCDLFINPSPAGGGMCPAGATRFLGGAPYAVIRREFVEAREAGLRRGREPRSVLVSTGSTDLNGIAGRVSVELLRMDQTVKVIKVVGPDSRADNVVDEPRLRVLHSPASLVEALAGASVYAGAAGTTALQAACMGVPAVLAAVVANQSAQAAALDAAGCAILVESGELAAMCLQLLADPRRCEDMASRGRELVDGLGAARVADAIRQLSRARAA